MQVVFIEHSFYDFEYMSQYFWRAWTDDDDYWSSVQTINDNWLC